MNGKPTRQQLRAAARAADKARDSRMSGQDLQQGGHYLIAVHEVEERIMGQVMAVRALMKQQEGVDDRWSQVSWREAIVTELDGVLPILRELQDLPAPTSVQDVAHLIARYAGAMTLWATTLQKGMRAADAQQGADLVERSRQHMVTAEQLRYGQVSARLEHIAQQMNIPLGTPDD